MIALDYFDFYFPMQSSHFFVCSNQLYKNIVLFLKKSKTAQETNKKLDVFFLMEGFFFQICHPAILFCMHDINVYKNGMKFQ